MTVRSSEVTWGSLTLSLPDLERLLPMDLPLESDLSLLCLTRLAERELMSPPETEIHYRVGISWAHLTSSGYGSGLPRRFCLCSWPCPQPASSSEAACWASPGCRSPTPPGRGWYWPAPTWRTGCQWSPHTYRAAVPPPSPPPPCPLHPPPPRSRCRTCGPRPQLGLRWEEMPERGERPPATPGVRARSQWTRRTPGSPCSPGRCAPLRSRRAKAPTQPTSRQGRTTTAEIWQAVKHMGDPATLHDTHFCLTFSSEYWEICPLRTPSKSGAMSAVTLRPRLALEHWGWEVVRCSNNPNYLTTIQAAVSTGHPDIQNKLNSFTCCTLCCTQSSRPGIWCSLSLPHLTDPDIELGVTRSHCPLSSLLSAFLVRILHFN